MHRIAAALLAGLLLVVPGTLPATAETPSGPPLPETAPAPSDNPDGPPLPRARPVMPDPALETTAGDELPADELACRARLKALGAKFEVAGPRSASSGCAVEHPLRVERLSAEIAIEPEALLNCATAETAARFLSKTASPRAEETLGAPISAVRHMSAYVCRPRSGTETLSEHAFGNALDIGGFTLEDGRTVIVRDHAGEAPRRDRFLDAVREAACGPFKTVLGPGTNADHANHFHFDMAERSGDGTYCR